MSRAEFPSFQQEVREHLASEKLVSAQVRERSIKEENLADIIPLLLLILLGDLRTISLENVEPMLGGDQRRVPQTTTGREPSLSPRRRNQIL